MTNKTKFLKFGIAVVLGTGAAGILYAQLNIPTNIDNAVMTIKQINITEEGKDTTPKVIIDGSASDDNFLKVEGSILMGTITGSATNVNKVSGLRSSVLGGQQNDLDGDDSVIVGGKINRNFGDASIIAGGSNNTSNGIRNTIIGGQQNTVTGSYSTIAGGQLNNINAINSFAAGKNTQVNNQGTFVWSDNYNYLHPNNIFSSFRDYTFLIRARNGVGINTGNTTTGYALTLQGSGIVYGNMVSNGYYYKEITAADEAYELTLSQWQDAVQTGNIYYNSGYVGIGLNNPAAQLHVNGAVRIQGLTSLSESTALMIDLNGNLSTRELGTSAFVGYTAPVTSVAGRVGAIILAKSDVGLLNVDNTSDLNKPISTATQNALDDKAPLSSPGFIGIPTAPTAAAATNNTQIATTAFVKSQGFISTAPVTSVAGKLGDVTLERGDVGLSNVNNTSDLDKPISTATQTALNAKASLANPGFTGIPTAPTAGVSTNNTQIATTAFVKSQGFITTAPVTSVAGKVGAVTLAKSDVGLSNVDDIQQIPLSYLDITTTLGTSNIKVPSQNAVKVYVDTQISGLPTSYVTTTTNQTVGGVKYFTNNMGIGVSVPSYRLDVGGSARIAGDLYAAAFYYSSDRSLKDNLLPISNSLEKVNKLQGYNFTWKSSGKKDIGLVAQEVEKVFPELVEENAAGKKNVAYGNLVAPIIEAIKELYSKYLDQQNKIDELENRIQSLERNINK